MWSSLDWRSNRCSTSNSRRTWSHLLGWVPYDQAITGIGADRRIWEVGRKSESLQSYSWKRTTVVATTGELASRSSSITRAHQEVFDNWHWWMEGPSAEQTSEEEIQAWRLYGSPVRWKRWRSNFEEDLPRNWRELRKSSGAWSTSRWKTRLLEGEWNLCRIVASSHGQQAAGNTRWTKLSHTECLETSTYRRTTRLSKAGEVLERQPNLWTSSPWPWGKKEGGGGWCDVLEDDLPLHGSLLCQQGHSRSEVFDWVFVGAACFTTAVSTRLRIALGSRGLEKHFERVWVEPPHDQPKWLWRSSHETNYIGKQPGSSTDFDIKETKKKGPSEWFEDVIQVGTRSDAHGSAGIEVKDLQCNRTSESDVVEGTCRSSTLSISERLSNLSGIASTWLTASQSEASSVWCTFSWYHRSFSCCLWCGWLERRNTFWLQLLLGWSPRIRR